MHPYPCDTTTHIDKRKQCTILNITQMINMHEPKIEYKTVFINQNNVKAFLLLPGVRGICHDIDNRIVIYKYTICDDLFESPKYNDIRIKVAKLQNMEQIFLAHELHHAQNNSTVGVKTKIANNIYEFMGMCCMDEASAFSAGALHGLPKTGEYTLLAAIQGTNEFLERQDIYLNKFKNFLYSSVVSFDASKPTHRIIEKHGAKFFEKNYSYNFHSAISAYFTFDGFALGQDEQLRQTPQWQQFRNNVKKIQKLSEHQASTITEQLQKIR